MTIHNSRTGARNYAIKHHYLPILRRKKSHSGGKGRKEGALRQMSWRVARGLLPSAAVRCRQFRQLYFQLSRTGAGRVLGTLVTALHSIRTGGADSCGKTGRQGSSCSDQYRGEPYPGVTLRRARHTGNHAVALRQNCRSACRSADG